MYFPMGQAGNGAFHYQSPGVWISNRQKWKEEDEESDGERGEECEGGVKLACAPCNMAQARDIGGEEVGEVEEIRGKVKKRIQDNRMCM